MTAATTPTAGRTLSAAPVKVATGATAVVEATGATGVVAGGGGGAAEEAGGGGGGAADVTGAGT